jgi:hypothetical protein
MIICSKDEGNGTFREFVLDDSEAGDEVPVKTHLANERVWSNAGVITRAAEGLVAAVAEAPGDFVKLNKLFSNEIAALQAIALHYKMPVLN